MSAPPLDHTDMVLLDATWTGPSHCTTMAGLAGRAYLSLSGTRKRVARLKSAGLLTSEQGKQGTLRLTAVGRAALDMGGAQ